MATIDFALLEQYRDNGLITIRKHPDGDLFIHNYTPKVQYDRLWDDVTCLCRGLITDGQGNIKARGFAKFKNLQEHTPEEILSWHGKPYTVTTKLDGSIGILYFRPTGGLAIATRGSFVSEQAQWATEFLHRRYPDFCQRYQDRIPDDQVWTWLFEIIYPANKIVVDYGQREDLVLLAVVNNETGDEVPYHGLPTVAKCFAKGMPVVERFDGDWQALPDHIDNEEGFVIAFHHTVPPTRVKSKFDSYVRLHKVLSYATEHGIWECLKDGVGLDMFLENVPDEFYGWVRKVETRLRSAYTLIQSTCEEDFKVLETRKDTALYYKTCQYPSVLFAMLDGKPIERIIWKMLEPAGDARYTKEKEE